MTDNLEQTNIPIETIGIPTEPKLAEVALPSAEDVDSASDRVISDSRLECEAFVRDGKDRVTPLLETATASEVGELVKIDERVVGLDGEAQNVIPWIRDRFDLSKMEREYHQGFEVQGSLDFRQKFRVAIDILSQVPSKMMLAQAYVRRIQEWERSGINMFKDTPTFEVGDIWRTHDPVYLASGIVHEARHSELCMKSHDGEGNIAVEAFVGKGAERECITAQIEFLEELKATGYYDGTDFEAMIHEHIEYLLSIVSNPTYQDIPYEERDW